MNFSQYTYDSFEKNALTPFTFIPLIEATKKLSQFLQDLANHYQVKIDSEKFNECKSFALVGFTYGVGKNADDFKEAFNRFGYCLNNRNNPDVVNFFINFRGYK